MSDYRRRSSGPQQFKCAPNNLSLTDEYVNSNSRYSIPSSSKSDLSNDINKTLESCSFTLPAGKRAQDSEQEMLLRLWQLHQEECDNYRKHPETHPGFGYARSLFYKRMETKGYDTQSDAIQREWKKLWDICLERNFENTWKARHFDKASESNSLGGNKGQPSKSLVSSLGKCSSQQDSLVANCSKSIESLRKASPTQSKNYKLLFKRPRSESPKCPLYTPTGQNRQSPPKDNKTSPKLKNKQPPRHSRTPPRPKSKPTSKNNITSLRTSNNPPSKHNRTSPRLRSKSPSKHNRASPKSKGKSPLEYNQTYPRPKSKSPPKHNSSPSRPKSNSPFRRRSRTPSMSSHKSHSRHNSRTSSQNNRSDFSEGSPNTLKQDSIHLLEESTFHVSSSSNANSNKNVQTDNRIIDSASSYMEEPHVSTNSRKVFYEYVELFSLLKEMPGKFGVLSNSLGILHGSLLKAFEADKPLFEVIDEDSETFIIILKEKLETFLKDPSISAVQRAIYNEALKRVISLLKYLTDYASVSNSSEEQNSDVNKLKLDNIAKATMGKNCSETINFIKTTLMYRGIKGVSNDVLLKMYLNVKDIQRSY